MNTSKPCRMNLTGLSPSLIRLRYHGYHNTLPPAYLSLLSSPLSLSPPPLSPSPSLCRLNALQTLAEKILSACDSHDATLAQIEKRVEQFEESSTKMDPQEAAKMTTELQQEIDVSRLK